MLRNIAKKIFAVKVVMISLFILLASLYSRKQGLWHDEIYTLTFLNGFSVYNLPETVWDSLTSPTSTSEIKNLFEQDFFWNNFTQLITNEGHPPLFFISLKLWTYLFGDTVFSIRLFSVACGALFFLAISKILDLMRIPPTKHLLVFLFFILNPFLLFYFTEARMYAMSLFLAGCIFYLWLSILFYNNSSYGKWAALITLSICLCYTHYYGVFFTATLAFITLLKSRNFSFVYPFLLVFIVFLLWFGFIQEQIGLHSQHWTDGSVSFTKSFLGFLTSIINLHSSPWSTPNKYQLFFYTGILLLIIFVLIRHNTSQIFRYCLLGLSLNFLMIFIFDQILDHHTILVPRYYSYTLLFTLVIIVELAKKLEKRMSILTLLVLLVINLFAASDLFSLKIARKQMIREVSWYIDNKFNSKNTRIVSEPKGPLIIGVAYYLNQDFTFYNGSAFRPNNDFQYIFLDENLGVSYRENKFNHFEKKKKTLTPFVGINLYE